MTDKFGHGQVVVTGKNREEKKIIGVPMWGCFIQSIGKLYFIIMTVLMCLIIVFVGLLASHLAFLSLDDQCKSSNCRSKLGMILALSISLPTVLVPICIFFILYQFGMCILIHLLRFRHLDNKHIEQNDTEFRLAIYNEPVEIFWSTLIPFCLLPIILPLFIITFVSFLLLVMIFLPVFITSAIIYKSYKIFTCKVCCKLNISQE